MPRPIECEFSHSTKLEALQRANWCCEKCGIPKDETIEGYLQIHHIVGIALASRHHPELAPAMIASLANARVLCEKCHKAADVEDRKLHRANALLLASQFSLSR